MKILGPDWSVMSASYCIIISLIGLNFDFKTWVHSREIQNDNIGATRGKFRTTSNRRGEFVVLELFTRGWIDFVKINQHLDVWLYRVCDILCLKFITSSWNYDSQKRLIFRRRTASAWGLLIWGGLEQQKGNCKLRTPMSSKSFFHYANCVKA